MKNKYKKGGMSILGMAIMAIFIYVILKVYFNIHLEDLANQQVVDAYHQTTFSLSNFWHQYLQHPVQFLWNSFLENMQKIHDGQPTILQSAGQNLILPN